MKEILLTNGGSAVVDDEDFALLAGRSWFRTEKGYARHHQKVAGRTVGVFMHREILGAKKGEKTDHRDRDRLNNRRANLRRCTTSQNNANTVCRSHTSKYKGVWKESRRTQFDARISVDGKCRRIGRFATEEQAARAYDAAARAHFGDFALCNFPEREA